VRWYESDGWQVVPDGKRNPEIGDVFLIQFDNIAKVPTHCTVYVGNGVALHHRWDRPCCKIPVAPFQHLIHSVVRYTKG
jgi:cell wall-associated NlpC family hydrolase